MLYHVEGKVISVFRRENTRTIEQERGVLILIYSAFYILLYTLLFTFTNLLLYLIRDKNIMEQDLGVIRRIHAAPGTEYAIY